MYSVGLFLLRVVLGVNPSCDQLIVIQVQSELITLQLQFSVGKIFKE